MADIPGPAWDDTEDNPWVTTNNNPADWRAAGEATQVPWERVGVQSRFRYPTWRERARFCWQVLRTGRLGFTATVYVREMEGGVYFDALKVEEL